MQSKDNASNLNAEVKSYAKELKQITSRYNLELSKKDKERLASDILNVWVRATMKSPNQNLIEDKYQIFNSIEELSSKLDWSNSVDINKDWVRLIEYINLLAEQVKETD